MLKILTIILVASLSIVIAVILNAWLLLPVTVSLYFLTKKFLNAAKYNSIPTHPVVRFGFVMSAAIFVTALLSGFLILLVVLAFILGFDPNKECKDPSEITSRIACSLFLGNDEFRTNTEKIINSILPQKK